MIDPKTLTELVMTNFAMPATYAGQRFLLDGTGALYWPKHDLLVFSDLHFEKGSFLTQFAHPVPRYDTHETIKRMAFCIERYSPKSVICLGDSFHDGNAGRRMEASQIEALNHFVASVEQWIWILGNHDPDIPSVVKGLIEPTWMLDNLVFLHEPEDENLYANYFQVIGHFHPKTSTVIARHKVTGSCFVKSKSLFIMPAFGKFTGGLSTRDQVLINLIDDDNAKFYMTFNKKVYLV